MLLSLLVALGLAAVVGFLVAAGIMWAGLRLLTWYVRRQYLRHARA